MALAELLMLAKIGLSYAQGQAEQDALEEEMERLEIMYATERAATSALADRPAQAALRFAPVHLRNRWRIQRRAGGQRAATSAYWERVGSPSRGRSEERAVTREETTLLGEEDMRYQEAVEAEADRVLAILSGRDQGKEKMASVMSKMALSKTGIWGEVAQAVGTYVADVTAADSSAADAPHVQPDEDPDIAPAPTPAPEDPLDFPLPEGEAQQMPFETESMAKQPSPRLTLNPLTGDMEDFQYGDIGDADPYSRISLWGRRKKNRFGMQLYPQS
jgi:hypothetical protein